MAANYNIKQGEDVIIEAKISDVIDLSTASEILVAIAEKKVIKYKYSLNTKEGYGDLIIKASTIDTIQIMVKRDETKLLNTGYLNLSILVEFPDTALTDKRIEYQFDNYILVETGIMKDLII